MFTLWYKRSFEKLYCNEKLKKPKFFDVNFSFWIFFNVKTFFSFWDIYLSISVFLITFITIRFDDLRFCINDKYEEKHLNKRLTCFINALSCDFHSLSFNLHSIHSISSKSLFEIRLNSVIARSLNYDVNKIWNYEMKENVKITRRSL